MRTNLTDRAIKRKAPATGTMELWDQLLPGFGLRIGKKRRTYFVMGRVEKRAKIKQIRRTVGSTVELTLAEARSKARGMLADFQRGVDPKDAEKVARRQAELARRNTFAAVAEGFMEERAKHLRTRDEYRRKLDVDILPEWSDLLIAEIERADVKVLFQKKAATSPIAANRLLTLIKSIFNYAIDEELISASPAQRIKPEPEVERERVLTGSEIKNFWSGLDAAPIDPQVRHLLRFLLVTGQRRGEAVGMQWGEVDFEANEWTIPASRAKSGKAHVVPLSDLALELLKDMASASQGDFVFPGARENSPLSAYSVSQGMRKSLKALKLADNPATPHDLRRSFASGLAELGFPRLTVSKLLNHREGGITAVYDRYAYAEEMRTAMQAWGARLVEIVSGKPKPDNVIDLREQR